MLRHRDFRRFFIGQSASMLGDQFSDVAIPLAAIILLGAGSVELGLLTALGLDPHKENVSPALRPLKVADGEPIQELLT